MKWYFFIFVSVFLAIYAAVNFYIGLRGWQAIGRWFLLPKFFYWSIFFLISFSYLIGRLGGKFLPTYLGNGLTLIGAFWMAALVYLVLIVVSIDFFSFINNKINFFPKIEGKNLLFSGLMVLAVVIGLLVYGFLNAKDIKITNYNICIPKQAGNLKQLHIAMISDIHLGNIVDRTWLLKIIDRINSLKPDIVLICGDIIDDDFSVFKKLELGIEFNKIKSKYGIYASLGNHDYFSRNLQELENEFYEAGITILRDNSAEIADSFNIIGRNDKYVETIFGEKRKPLSIMTEKVNNNLPLILLDHQPIDINEAISCGIDLQLSGHTHAGQLFPFNIITKSMFIKDWGYLKKNNLQLIVSSGAGTWGPPVRIGSFSEVINIVINFK